MPSREQTLREQLGRLGGTPFVLRQPTAHIVGRPMVPFSVLGSLRHELVRPLGAACRPAPPIRRIASEPVLARAAPPFNPLCKRGTQCDRARTSPSQIDRRIVGVDRPLPLTIPASRSPRGGRDKPSMSISRISANIAKRSIPHAIGPLRSFWRRRAFKSPTKWASSMRWRSTAPTAFWSAIWPASASSAIGASPRLPIFRSTPPTS